MSFANYDIEAQHPLGKRGQREEALGSAQDPDSQTEATNGLNTIIGKTSAQLQVFGSLISQLDIQRKQVGTRRDCLQLRENIEELTTDIGGMDRSIQLLILNILQLINKKLTVKPSNLEENRLMQVSNKQMVVKERLVSEFSELHRLFQRSIRLYNEKKRSYPLKDILDHHSNQAANETTPLISSESNGGQLQSQLQVQEQQQEDTINDTELQYHILLTEERNREINQVTEGIVEVNAIFKDLGQLVTQQGELLDTIEDNILQLQGNTQQALRELTKANEYQKAKSKWSCIILVALSIFVLIIILAAVS